MKIIPQIIFFIITIFFILGLGHLVVYKSFISILNITNTRLIYFIRFFFIISLISFIISTLITQASYTWAGSLFYKISAIWLGTFYFLFIASVVFAIIYFISSYFGLPDHLLKIIGGVLFIIAFVFSIYGVYNSFNINITNYNLKINNLPESWNGKDIILISDSHFGNIRNINFGKKLVSKINDQKSTAVFISGDYYDGPPTNYEQIAKLMTGVKTEKGIYFASGNHEEYGKHLKFIESLEDSGVKVLDQKSFLVDGILIAGVDYAFGSNEYVLDNVLKNMDLKIDTPKILIKHAPTLLPIIEKYKFDLVLSGHVHNGQVWPGSLIAKKIFKEFSYGLNYLNKMAVVTSSGVGTWGPPQRIGTKSEIVVIRLEKGN